jgi:hypothetical protein
VALRRSATAKERHRKKSAKGKSMRAPGAAVIAPPYLFAHLQRLHHALMPDYNRKATSLSLGNGAQRAPR